MKSPNELLAKSIRRGRPPLTLEKHLLDTESAAQLLFSADKRWGVAWRRFFRLSDADARRFELHLRLAGLFHDLGKANEDFVGLVYGSSKQQTLRHEHLSALVLCLPLVRSWLSANSAIDIDVVVAAVLSHHIKASEGGSWAWCQPRGGFEVNLRLTDTQVVRILERVAAVSGLAQPPTLPSTRWHDGSPWRDAFHAGIAAARALNRSVRRDPQRRALLLATKAGLIAADAAASGLVREGHSIEQWIDETAHSPAIGPKDIEEAILQPRAAAISQRTGAPFSFHQFQLGAATVGPRALLLAACGAGKTLAAWKWAEAQSQARPLGRVIFLYPTRGTATEGFRDYVSWAPEQEAALVHASARYELEGMMSNPSQGGAGKDFSLSEDEARLFALGLWSRRYFSATVDQFLSFLENRYSSLCLLPALADCALIIDEVHSFDRKMFNDLIAFLRDFDVPVLCMTATLPPSQREQLIQVGLRAYPDESESALLVDLNGRENHPRYAIEPLVDADAAFAVATEAFRRGNRVLWVVNVVARSQVLADRLSQELGVDVLCYHSRYRLSDRQRIHRATVEAFQRSEPAIAVTTQVCEMSLDLDADVLLTEYAPITALVQRFGRSNRHLAKGPDFRAKIHPYPAPHRLPYDEIDLAPVEPFLQALGGDSVSQRQLAETLERLAPARPRVEGAASFLEGGYFAIEGAFRDADEHARQCVLDGDLVEVESRLKRHLPIDGYVLSAPKGAVSDRDPLPGWLPPHLGVAAGSLYRPDRGLVMPSRGDARDH